MQPSSLESAPRARSAADASSVSVIVPVYNGAASLDELVDRIVATRERFGVAEEPA